MTLNTYDVVYLSPHLDDAVLSCGGQMAARARRGESVLVYTPAAGDPPDHLSPLALHLHEAWGLAPDAAMRRAEDERACAVLGVTARHGDAPDALYRRHPGNGEPLYPTQESLFSVPHPEDRVAQDWEKDFRALPKAKRYMAPLAIGDHVDHQLVRRAAEQVFGSALQYYEDYPYSGKRMALLRYTLTPWQWRAQRIPLSAEDVAARCRAVMMYDSQVDMLFNGRANVEPKIRSYVRRVGGERVWSLR